MKTKKTLEEIRLKIQDAMANSMASFSFEDVIDNSDLTEAEKKQAKQNLDWKVVIL